MKLIKLSNEEINKLMFCIGYAIGAAAKNDESFVKMFSGLASTIQSKIDRALETT
jgi:hypothetical protein